MSVAGKVNFHTVSQSKLAYEKLTCDLRLKNDGVWRGRWLAHEKMPIELVPKLGIG